MPSCTPFPFAILDLGLMQFIPSWVTIHGAPGGRSGNSFVPPLAPGSPDSQAITETRPVLAVAERTPVPVPPPPPPTASPTWPPGWDTAPGGSAVHRWLCDEVAVRVRWPIVTAQPRRPFGGRVSLSSTRREAQGRGWGGCRPSGGCRGSQLSSNPGLACVRTEATSGAF